MSYRKSALLLSLCAWACTSPAPSESEVADATKSSRKEAFACESQEEGQRSSLRLRIDEGKLVGTLEREGTVSPGDFLSGRARTKTEITFRPNCAAISHAASNVVADETVVGALEGSVYAMTERKVAVTGVCGSCSKTRYSPHDGSTEGYAYCLGQVEPFYDGEMLWCDGWQTEGEQALVTLSARAEGAGIRLTFEDSRGSSLEPSALCDATPIASLRDLLIELCEGSATH